MGNAQQAGDAESPYQPSKGPTQDVKASYQDYSQSRLPSPFYISIMANRGKSHDSKVYSVEDLERLGSERMHKAYRGRQDNFHRDIII